MIEIHTELLNGKSLHCRPVEEGPVIEAQVIPTDSIGSFNKVIICAARLPNSKCALLIKAGINGGFCRYYRGDGRGVYQIVGLDMDNKKD